MTKKLDASIAFFGTPQFAVQVLEELEDAGIVPDVVVTAPDKPAGRGLKLSAPAVKEWAVERDIPTLQPSSLKPNPSGQPQEVDQREREEALALLTNSEWDLFIVAAYGLILPKAILDLPRCGALNVHPSLLPRFRGASPIESQILSGEAEVGVTIMKMDEKMDHGPIVAQASITPDNLPAKTEWPLSAPLLEELLAREGGRLLAETIPPWLEGSLSAQPQDEEKATYTKKIEKVEGQIDLTADAYENYLKYLAYQRRPGIFFFDTKNGQERRVKITSAVYENGTFTPLTVIPEGRSEIDFSAWREA